jgi:hypothetical protein
VLRRYLPDDTFRHVEYNHLDHSVPRHQLHREGEVFWNCLWNLGDSMQPRDDHWILVNRVHFEHCKRLRGPRHRFGTIQTDAPHIHFYRSHGDFDSNCIKLV